MPKKRLDDTFTIYLKMDRIPLMFPIIYHFYIWEIQGFVQMQRELTIQSPVSRPDWCDIRELTGGRR